MSHVDQDFHCLKDYLFFKFRYMKQKKTPVFYSSRKNFALYLSKEKKQSSLFKKCLLAHLNRIFKND